MEYAAQPTKHLSFITSPISSHCCSIIAWPEPIGEDPITWQSFLVSMIQGFRFWYFSFKQEFMILLSLVIMQADWIVLSWGHNSKIKLNQEVSVLENSFRGPWGICIYPLQHGEVVIHARVNYSLSGRQFMMWEKTESPSTSKADIVRTNL